MDHLIDLFKLIELTRSQPQYGYALAGIQQDELSNLAEHHYLVSFIAWQIATNLKERGAKIDMQKVFELSLIHDLGELFGGDISMPYARSNPEARKLAKAFESENQNYFSRFLGPQKDYYLNLSKEIMDPHLDESIITKIADYIEVTHYKIYIKAFSKFDLDLVEPKLVAMIEKVKDPISKKELNVFIEKWIKALPGKMMQEIIFGTDLK